MPRMHTVYLGVDAFAPVDHCPRCGSSTVDGLPLGERIEFRCAACSLGWRLEAGHVIELEGHPREVKPRAPQGSGGSRDGQAALLG